MTRAALVTGASSGIGRATALALARSGWTVFAGVRSSAAADALAAGGPSGIEPLLLDVTDAEGIAHAVQQIRGRVGREGLRGVVSNAGIGVGGPVEEVELSEWRHHLEVNLVGGVAVVQATLPLLRDAHGRLVLISSDNGRWAPPFMGAYAASKFALEAVADALRLELRHTGVLVSLVEPGAIRTAIWEKGRERLRDYQQTVASREKYGDLEAWFHRMLTESEERAIPAERVAEVVLKALTAPRPRARYVVGNDARIMIALRTLLPDRAFDALIARKLPR